MLLHATLNMYPACLATDQCWELIIVNNMLGVVAARPSCSTILMTQFSWIVTEKGMSIKIL